jgi:L-threonylcarbamoyladenylate synthase
VARALVSAAGLPIAAPSANLFSRPSPTSAQHVLHDLGGRIDLIVDGGPTTIGVESTVVDLTTTPPLVLRPGAVTLEMLRAIVPGIRARGDAPVDDTAPQVSPGMLGRHYSPRTPLTLYRGAGARVRLETDADAMRARGQRVAVLDWPADLDSVAKRLYAALREADATGADAILARDIDAAGGLAEALRDRLRRAAATIVDA